MPYKGITEDQENLIQFARGGSPNLADTDTFGGPRPTKIDVRDYGPPAMHVCGNKHGGSRCDICFGEIPEYEEPRFKNSVSGPARVHTLVPKPEPSEKDDILEVLDTLAAEIRSGKVTPSHLIIGFGEDLPDNAFAYSWDAIGLNRFEVMGFMQVYISDLAAEER